MKVMIEEIMRHYEEGVTDRGGCGGPVLVTMFMLLLLFVLSGCKSIQYVPVVEYHTDSIYITKWQRDSVWLHDSVTIKERGDSVWVERWHTKYIEKLKTDTLYKATHDTIPAPYPVPAENTVWEKVKIRYGGWAMGAVAAGIGLLALRLKRKLII